MPQSVIAKLVFEVIDSKASIARKFDEQWRLFDAADNASLHLEILKVAQKESEEIKRNDGSVIRWNFVACTEIVSLNQPNGSELFSSMNHPAEIDQYLSFQLAKNILFSTE